jgi:hypothetical protein
MPYGTINADVIQTSTSGGILGAGNASIMKNRIINGAMLISQRNGTSSVTPTNGLYTLDRWQFYVSQASKLTAQQNAGSVTPPTGFTNYLGVTSSSAYSVVAGDYFSFQQYIEGFNTADLDFGKSTAKTITLSFWVRSSLTGTFGGSLGNNANNRSYPFTYIITTANTWQQISVTIAGDTSGTWETTNSIGLAVYFGLGVGSTSSGTAGSWAGANYVSATGATSVVGTNGATFYITGVQLEVGSSATGFEYRQYGTELNLCLRYTFVGTSDVLTTNFGRGSTNAYAQVVLPVQMRATPTPTISGSLFITGNGNSGGDITATSPTVAANGLSNIGGRMDIAGYNSTVTNNSIYGGTSQGASGKITFSAEL